MTTQTSMIEWASILRDRILYARRVGDVAPGGTYWVGEWVTAGMRPSDIEEALAECESIGVIRRLDAGRFVVLDPLSTSGW